VCAIRRHVVLAFPCRLIAHTQSNMNFYKNQEILVTAKFVGIADDGKLQVKIRGIDNVTFDIDKQFVSLPGASPSTTTTEASPKKAHKSSKRKKKEAELDEAAAEAWGADDEDLEAAADADEDLKQPEQTQTEPEPTYDADADKSDDADAEDADDGDDSPLGAERFHAKHKFKTATVEENGAVLRASDTKSVMCGFGSVECGEEGRQYHWKVKVLEGSNDVNVGVIWSETAKKNKKQMWWLDEMGYAYWGDDGQVYHGAKYKEYGATYGEGDVIDVWLNLKKWNVAFAKNGEKYGKAFKVEKKKSYRLGVGFNGPHAVRLLEFTHT